MSDRARFSAVLAALLGLLWAGAPLHAADELEPRALGALQQMGSYLRSLREFAIQADSVTDQLLESGQAVEFRHHTELLAQRPDRLRVSVESQGARRSLYYDGEAFTLYDSRGPYYARAPAPASIDALVQRLSDNYGIELPLADLFRWDADTAQKVGLTSALYIASETLGDQRCAHYAFRQSDIDWQLWLREGPRPLPCRLVISRRDSPEQPRHSVDYRWQLKPAPSAASFAFKPPAGATQVPLRRLERSAAQGEVQP
ncbi:DUF2092 domain-containing protein [Pseudomonas protegens]|uniref:DUF2092 domain-containing protein n=1 Tax=Pseudomonas protegens TaxID=380021 RepID=UPI000CD10979|nr:DUF2092 domain-containing protein [Pseudomonas protegens]MCU1769488.1 DUF2092 domain-containing protein [Pseudomonas protegens]POA80955.1 hypothetical protein C1883_31285 [Pseudomonas protegens]